MNKPKSATTIPKPYSERTPKGKHSGTRLPTRTDAAITTPDAMILALKMLDLQTNKEAQHSNYGGVLSSIDLTLN